MGLFGGLLGSTDRVGLFVDGPNVLRSEFDVDLDDVRAVAEKEGRPAIARVYLDEHASSGLIQAAEARGFEVVTTSGDVDVKLAVDATAAVVDEEFDVLAIAPGEHGRSDALQNVAHEAVSLDADR